jgi:Raf kinase inhibitor-like YbhB/YbcL family protein
MAGEFFGRLFHSLRAGDEKMAWNRPELQALESLVVTSPAFAHGAPMPLSSAGKGVGDDVSPALEWSGVPPETQQLVLVLEDPDAPTPRPFVHTIAGIIPDRTELAAGELSRQPAPAGVTYYRASMGGFGYRGPRPVPGHGPHSYVFQFFALREPLGVDAGTASTKSVFAALAGKVIARGRLDGTYER